MSLPALWQASSNYKISTDEYEGPLDLLLQLVEQAELDITAISLAKVTNQYLFHLQNLTKINPIEISAFLVIAAKLVLLKSIILLPADAELGEEEEGTADQLVRQLILYKEFKEKANWLQDRFDRGLRSYIRVSKPVMINEILDLSDTNIYDLVDILLNLFFQHENATPMSDVVTISTLSIKNKIAEIVDLFQKQSTHRFSDFIKTGESRVNLVVTFLALLELIKNYSIKANQENLFGEINFESIGTIRSDFETEL